MTGSRLEAISNLCLIATCVVLSAGVVKRFWGADARPTISQDAGYAKGEKLPPIEGLRLGEKPKTLLLFLSSGCRFCTESMPFYAKLSGARHLVGYQLVVLGKEPQNALVDYVSKHGVEADRVLTVRPGTLKVGATPTIIVADNAGRVQGHWRGVLGARESEVEGALAR